MKNQLDVNRTRITGMSPFVAMLRKLMNLESLYVSHSILLEHRGEKASIYESAITVSAKTPLQTLQSALYNLG